MKRPAEDTQKIILSMADCFTVTLLVEPPDTVKEEDEELNEEY